VRHFAQHGVPGAVAVAVVVVLEVVEVAEQDAEGLLQLARVQQFLAEAFVQVAMVVEAGQRIRDRVYLRATEAGRRGLQHGRERMTAGPAQGLALTQGERGQVGRHGGDDLPGGIRDRSEAGDPDAELVCEDGVHPRARAREYLRHLLVVEDLVAEVRVQGGVLLGIDADDELPLPLCVGGEIACRWVGVTHLAQDVHDLAVLLGVLVVGRQGVHVQLARDAGGGLGGDGLRVRPPLGEPVEHLEEHVDHLRIELRAAAAPQLRQALGVGERGLVRTPARHGVVGVDDRHRPGEGGDLVAGQAVRVPGAVVSLVVVADGEDEIRGEEGPDDVGAHRGVLAHLVPLLLVEAPRLEQHPVRDADLADVVEVGGLLERRECVLLPAEPAAEHDHVGGDAGGVAERVVILGVQRGAQRLEVAEMHALDLGVELGVPDRQRELEADPPQKVPVDGRERVGIRTAQAEDAEEPAVRRQRDDDRRGESGGDRRAGQRGEVDRWPDDDDALRDESRSELVVERVGTQSHVGNARAPRADGVLHGLAAEDQQGVLLEVDQVSELVDRGSGDLVEVEARGRSRGDVVEQLCLARRPLFAREQRRVVDRERSGMTDRRRGIQVGLGERPFGAVLDELHGSDRPFFDDQRQRHPALAFVSPTKLEGGPREARVAQRLDDRRLSCLEHFPCDGSGCQRKAVTGGGIVDLALAHAHQEAQLVAVDDPELAFVDIDDLAEPPRRGTQRLLQVEAGGQLQGRLADQRHPSQVVVQLAVEHGVADRLAGDLGQAEDDLVALEATGLVVHQGEEADHVAAADQRDVQTLPVVPLARLPDLLRSHGRVVEHIGRVDDAALEPGAPESAACAQREARPYRVDVIGLADREEGLDGVAVRAVHAAHVRPGDLQDPLGDAAQHLGDVERRSEHHA